MSDDMRFEQRMSDMDALMWSIEEDPLLRSTIVAVAVLDQPPDRDRLLDKLDRGTRMIPRLRQRVVVPPLRVAPPRWVVDANFDLGYHLRWMRAPGDGSLRALLDAAAPMAMQGFDRARPLWEFVVVEGLEGDRAALIQKIHHSVTDGVGGIKIALMLLDTVREAVIDPSPVPEAPAVERPSPFALLAEGLGHEQRRIGGVVRRALGSGPAAVLRDPVGVVAGAAATAASLQRLMAPAFQPLSPVMADRSLSIRLDTITADVADLKAAARAADGKLNDAFVAAVAGGLARYHAVHDADVETLRMGMPINIRSDATATLAGNQFVPARFPVPVTIGDPVERMREVRRLVAEARAEPALAFTEGIAGVLTRLPTAVVTQLFGGMLKGVDFITSNVPGLPFDVYLCGARLEAQYAFGPMSGAATNITLLSHVDRVNVGITSDPAAVPDPDVFLACLQEGFDEVVKAAG